MTRVINNIIFNPYSNGYKTGDDSYIYGNAVDGEIDNLDLVFPADIDGKPIIRIGAYSFRAVKANKLILPETLQEIGECGIDSCGLSIDELVLPNSITKIGLCAFSYESIRIFSLGENIESIGYGAFSHNSVLECIKVSDNNRFFASYNDALLSKDKKILYCVPYLKRGFKIPFSVTTLMMRSVNQKYATTIWIPQSITAIESDALFLVPNLRTIHFLGNSVSISENIVWSQNNKLVSVFYYGAATYNATDVFKNRPDVKVYVCKEYESEYFAGKKAIKLGTCYSSYRTCHKARRGFSNAILYITLFISA